jgi:ankyrin repeat protein
MRSLHDGDKNKANQMQESTTIKLVRALTKIKNGQHVELMDYLGGGNLTAAEINTPWSSKTKDTLLHYAATKGNNSAINGLIIGHGAEFKASENGTPLHLAARNNHLQAVSLIFKGFGGETNKLKAKEMMKHLDNKGYRADMAAIALGHAGI